ncbi:MAG: hypothetical protein FJX77_11035 [Armatimonadetes bacterium]|nr:hypothetical protein [Armatimonadota bacterium]
MTRCYVVVEGRDDEVVLRHLLEPSNGTAQLEFRVAGGRSAADSLARSLLASARGDVALVVDSDSVDPGLIAERKGFLRQSLQAIASPKRWHVTMLEPELEALFFRDRDLLESLVGHPVSDTDLVRGCYEPKRTLGELLGGASLRLVLEQKGQSLDLQRMREQSPICELRDFLRRVTEPAA